ncbi:MULTISPECIES: TonB-dependent receptor plug domain-containing protein [Weeksella]|uniref:TonB-dependent receptor n=1 Tax=Weeksella virosa (strain ATCC 43766 / DSM 16922 / JCM 21250 / CCUG 30538 / CDC 9751 / IAM 14551 / NBRC 16016 / NCTC 11634 / CL345/78) TaxID=865938 RepID=F0P0Q2_WEEVC|nr:MULTISPECIES: TonB-dependent receptor [Weeksella]ADX68551.1 TonB-dependent receptor [Weeksella virosa DSM 16922]OFM85726.1 TonB-dependent receptor [Weeksella sp. HMSC059D05]VEH63790.1 Colicin I receptor precursor [Weeksella virosa]
MKFYSIPISLLFGAFVLAQEPIKDTITDNNSNNLDEVVITGTMKPMKKSDSPVPIEIYTPAFFKKNPTPSLFDAVQLINGVQPQLNCNVCNTGDIHINGMEGPYTMVLIDGMPIVSSLSTVYGLSGIPNSLVDRIEVVKGPASSLYGTEAMGGIINVITKNPSTAPTLSLDAFTTTWLETNIDGGFKANIGKKAHSLLGFNYFKFGERKDNNHDGFTDVTLQDRISVFNKWTLQRPENKTASLALRYLYEDRWGGETNWKRKLHRGGEEVYGESIMTNRVEAIGMYQWPTKEKIFSQFSYNWHQQNSFYGPESYQAKQQVVFGQTYWDKTINQHSLLLGASYKYTYYDDDTRGTGWYDEHDNLLKNNPNKTPIFGIFIQDEWTLNPENKLLLGYRYDYDQTHKSIHSPRVAYKFSPNPHHTLRASFGTGFRVVNVFTEDHRALTGARTVVFENELKPEKSYNGNLNYVFKLPTNFAGLNFDLTAFYSYFTNKIIADTDTDQTKIIYDNLDGHAISQGISLNVEAAFEFPLKLMLGGTYMDVFAKEEGEKEVQYHAPKWSGNFLASYTFRKGFSVDFTGVFNGPMRLPRVENDYRPEYSPSTLIANLQITKKMASGLEIYFGAKNLFNVLPKNDAIARWWDPFGEPGNGVTPPPGRTDVIFEPNDYSYTPMQGIRGFAGIRYTIF